MSEYKLYSPLIQDPVTKQFYKRELKTHTGIVIQTQGGHCYINGSETTLTESLMRQRDQYKAERDTLIDDIAVLKANNDRYRKRAENAMEYAERSQCEVLRLERENEQRKKEQKVNRTKASLLTEIEQFKEKNEKLSELNNQLTFEIRNYEHDIKALRLQSNTYFNEWQSVKKQYNTLTNHIRMKAEHNPGVSRYLDLVNYIDRLEQK